MPKMAPKWVPKRIQNDSKIMLIFDHLFNRCLIDFGSILGALPPKTCAASERKAPPEASPWPPASLARPSLSFRSLFGRLLARPQLSFRSLFGTVGGRNHARYVDNFWGTRFSLIFGIISMSGGYQDLPLGLIPLFTSGFT